MRPLLFGIDPGFAALGHATIALDRRGEEVIDIGVLRTAASDKKRKMLAADDNTRRGRELARALGALMSPAPRSITRVGGGHVARVSLVCAESMSFPRSASAAAKVAISWGIIITNVDRDGLPLIQLSPQEVKKAITGKKNASKEEVRDALIERYGADAFAKLASVPESMREHAYDALASTVACLESDEVRALRQSIGG